MSQTTKLASSAVDHFAQFSPTDEDLAAVKEALRIVANDPRIGTPVPFTSSGLKDVYSLWAGNWRILYTVSDQSILILSIDRHDEHARK